MLQLSCGIARPSPGRALRQLNCNTMSNSDALFPLPKQIQRPRYTRRCWALAAASGSLLRTPTPLRSNHTCIYTRNIINNRVLKYGDPRDVDLADLLAEYLHIFLTLIYWLRSLLQLKNVFMTKTTGKDDSNMSILTVFKGVVVIAAPQTGELRLAPLCTTLWTTLQTRKNAQVHLMVTEKSHPGA